MTAHMRYVSSGSGPPILPVMWCKGVGSGNQLWSSPSPDSDPPVVYESSATGTATASTAATQRAFAVSWLPPEEVEKWEHIQEWKKRE